MSFRAIRRRNVKPQANRTTADRGRVRRRRLAMEALECRRVMDAAGLMSMADEAGDDTVEFAEVGSDWQNIEQPADVNADGEVSAIDALLVINQLNRRGAGPVADDGSEAADRHYIDTNGDGLLSPSDALRVINSLNVAALSTGTIAATSVADPEATDDVSNATRTVELARATEAAESAVTADVEAIQAETSKSNIEASVTIQANGASRSITGGTDGTRPVYVAGPVVRDDGRFAVGGGSESGPYSVASRETNGSSFDSRAWLIKNGATKSGVFRSGGMIVVIGTDRDDRVDVSNYGGTYVVTFNGRDYRFSESSISARKLIFFGNRGNDSFTSLTGGRNNLTILAYGGSGHDTLSGGDQSDTLYGETGNDRINGGNGHDHLEGGSGDDILNGEAGQDKLYGGYGRDTMNGGSGNDWLDGGSDHDQIFGDSGDDLLIGNHGDDRLYGGSGKDRLFGGVGRDYLSGGYDSDLLQGGDDNDELWGDASSDWLYGEGGTDTLYYQRGVDGVVSGENRIAVS